MKRIVVALTMLAIASCGNESTTDKQTAAPEQTSNAVTATEAAELPNMIIARVPIDAEGNELLDQVATRAASVDASTFANDASETVFAAANEVRIADELDSDSSTASYHWSRRWYPGRYLGRGSFWGRNPYANYYGRRHHYRYNGYYNYGSYRYYNYCAW